MKIVHIITRLIVGGAQENTLLTCEGLHARGHNVTLITGPTTGPEGQLVERARQGGYRVIEIESLQREINPLKDISAYKKLKQIIQELDPDIVHTHSAKGGILGRWAAYAFRIKTGSCCGRLEKFEQAQAKSHGKPKIVHTIHGLAFHPYESAFKNKLYIAAEKATSKRCDMILSVAQAMTDQALVVGIGRPEQYIKIFSGMETEDYLQKPSEEKLASIRQSYDIPNNHVVITSVARLFELKGHEYIIKSAKTIAKKYQNVIWLFVGDGILKDTFQKQINEAGLTKHFRFTGLVEPKEIGPILHASDILVHCSLREGLARALPQALLCGKPVISFDVDGAREVVINEESGYLIPPKDIPALIHAQEKLIEAPDKRQQYGQNGKSLCEKEFSHDLMVERIEQIYKSLI